MITKYKYNPDYVVHPGETLREKLQEMNMSPKEFAIRTGKPVKTISEVLNGKSSITPEMALLFEKVTGIPANFWMRKQANYNEFIARQKHKESIKQAAEWTRKFPYPELAKLGYVKPTRKIEEKTEELLRFFNISQASAWENIYINQQTPVFFRLSLKYSKDPYALSALLRIAEIEAEKIQSPVFDKKVLKDIIPELKQIMIRQEPDFLAQIQQTCLKAGVKVIYSKALSRTLIHGSVRWINDSPVIQMTDRLKRYDIFWFSLFHEIGHLLLHGNKKNIFIEEINAKDKDEKELEADRFAQETLLRSEDFDEIIKQLWNAENLIEKINQLAKEYNTHKDIIIGRILYQNTELYKFGFLQKEISRIEF